MKKTYKSYFKYGLPTIHYKKENVVKACPKCNGTGHIVINELTDYHRNEHSDFYYQCGMCAGEGRIVETTRSYHLTRLTMDGPEKEIVPLSKFEGDPKSVEYAEFGMIPDDDDVEVRNWTPHIQEQKKYR